MVSTQRLPVKEKIEWFLPFFGIDPRLYPAILKFAEAEVLDYISYFPDSNRSLVDLSWGPKYSVPYFLRVVLIKEDVYAYWITNEVWFGDVTKLYNVPFEEVLSSAPPALQESLIFHLDLFRDT